ncbi:ArnT family glycosyltransferase [Mucilaginibacter rubeus]|uniref:ArnT family glycosyltransferase n=1 Tax=Mucilaginibacter rubeus TaxID=2027860 RepID=UPI0016677795|nr:glycosyltransferase family 39 protein [Mucilaginibacter rubeus]GGB13465.1 dolichyl-phosphate-mannose--protein mannosyltransferase [Mucilaginibacter rubeus]
MESTAASIFSSQKRPYFIVLLLAIVLNVAGIGIKFFTDDGALYSALARSMAQSNNFTDLMYHGADWLDKPHFPFWIIAISFKIFGINTFAYKLPALLFFFMSVAYTYKLAKKFYGDETAIIAILILLTAQHSVMSNTDVRAEPYIMGLLMGAVYHFYKVKERINIADMLLASIFTACAVMTKGIYLLIPIGTAIIGDYLFKGTIKGVFHWKWLLSFILVVIFTLPEIYSVYTQFDLHPEKVVFGRTGISGIHWFLWDSQFGRFNNNGYITNTHGDKLFFVHTLLWAFAPWAILLFYALYATVRKMIKRITQPEYLCISGSVLMLLIFSASKFQLPFYANILFPFFAIITAVFISSLKAGAGLKFFKITQYIMTGLLLVAVMVLNFIFAPECWPVFVLLIAGFIGLSIYIYKKPTQIYQPVFLFTCAVSVLVNAYLVTVAYPIIVDYRGDLSAAEYLNQNYPRQKVSAAVLSNTFDFYYKGEATYSNVYDILKTDSLKSRIIVADEKAVAELKNKGIAYTIIKAFQDFPHENLSLPFIIKKKRSTTLDQFYLIRIR